MLERLQKIIARAGIASRRHAEELIVSGQVTVNGVIVTELGAKADPEKDRVEAAGRVAEQPVGVNYYILHKPPNVVCTMADPEGRATLRHVLRGLSGGVFPVGRLDYGSTGLILLTSDGQLADTIFKVSSSLLKVFWVKLKGRPSLETLAKVGHKAKARMRLLRAPGSSGGHGDNPWYEAELRNAHRDLLRQAFFAEGHPVEKMKRVQFGPLQLGDLPEGEYRQLAPSEVEVLRRAVDTAVAQGSALVGSAGAPAPVGTRAFERRKWRPKGDSGSERPPMHQGGGAGERGSYRPDQNQFRPAAKGAPNRGAPGGKRSFPPSGDFVPRPGGERFAPPSKGASSFGGPAGGKRFPPREDRGSAGGFSRGAGKSFGPRPGGDRFPPPSKGAPSYGGSAGGKKFPPGSDRSGTGSFGRDAGKSFRPSDRGDRPSAGSGGFGPRPGGDRFPPSSKGASDRGGPSGGKRFPPQGDRGGAGSFSRGAGKSFGPRPGGDRKFPPRGDRSGTGSFDRGAGKSFRPSDRSDRPSGGSRGFGPRPGGDRFPPPGKGASDRGGPSGGRKFPPRDDRGSASGFSRGAGTGKSFGPRPPSREVPDRGGAGGRKFPPRSDRSGTGSFSRGAGKSFGKDGDRGGYRGGDRGKGSSAGPRKFPPGPPRQGAAGPSKFRGKPGGRPSGRPPGRPSGRPSGRPPNRTGRRPSGPPKDAQ